MPLVQKIRQGTLASDIPAKAPDYRTPLASAIFDWTGPYLGIAGGWGGATSRHTNDITLGTSGDGRISGGHFGGTYGYNLQNGSWLIGFEGDFSWSGIGGNFTGVGGGFCPSTNQCVTDLLWFGTNRARLGYAWDRFLIFATAGIAFGKVEGTIENAGFLTGSNTRSGVTFGGGIEWALAPNWSAKAEYLRINNFGDEITYNVPAGNAPERISLKDVDIVRFGINYRFAAGKAPAPIATRY
jgi:outer membrane immunogenic protein